MRLMYQAAIEAYALGLKLAAPFNRKAAQWVNGRKNLPHLLDRLSEHSGALWMHCASVGEFEQGRPVFEALRNRYPTKKAVVSFFSPSGYEARKNWQGADLVFYLPVDRRHAMEAVVIQLQPSAVIWVKYEFWFNALAALRARNTPLFLVSGIFRPSQHFFQPWGGWFRQQLKSFSHCFVQDEQSHRLIASTGVDASVVGDTRFDRVCELAEEAFTDPIVEAFAAHAPVLVCGSTWPADEEHLCEATSGSDWRLIVVPHEITATHLAKIENLFPGAVMYSTTNPTVAAQGQVLVIDRMGMLSKLYRFGHAAYVGGGFGAGIHNTAEAAVYGIPVVFGPRFRKFNEAKALIASGGGCSIETTDQLRELLTLWHSETAQREASGRKARATILKGSGATQKIVEAVARHIQA